MQMSPAQSSLAQEIWCHLDPKCTSDIAISEHNYCNRRAPRCACCTAGGKARHDLGSLHTVRSVLDGTRRTSHFASCEPASCPS